MPAGGLSVQSGHLHGRRRVARELDEGHRSALWTPRTRSGTRIDHEQLPGTTDCCTTDCCTMRMPHNRDVCLIHSRYSPELARIVHHGKTDIAHDHRGEPVDAGQVLTVIGIAQDRSDGCDALKPVKHLTVSDITRMDDSIHDPVESLKNVVAQMPVRVRQHPDDK